MSGNEWFESFKGIFGQAITATLIPYLAHSALIQLSKFGPDQGYGVPVLAGKHPKKPTDQVNHAFAEKTPPVHNFLSIRHQNKLNPNHSSQGGIYIQSSIGGEKENEGESKEGEEGEGFGEYYDSFEPAEESDGYIPLENDQEEENNEDELEESAEDDQEEEPSENNENNEGELEELAENDQEEENNEDELEELVENDQVEEESEKNESNEGELEESAEKEIQEEVEQLKEYFLQTLDSHSKRIDKLIEEVQATSSLISGNSGFEATWNQNAAAYRNLSEEIEELHNSMIDQGLDSKELGQMRQKLNELTQEQENLVSIMERRTLATLAEAREKNIREQERQVESEEQSVRESTREQIRQIVEEKFLHLQEYAKAQTKIHEININNIHDQYRSLISLVKDLEWINLKDIESDIENQCNEHNRQYIQIADNIARLLDQKSDLGEKINEETGADEITAKIESLLDQQSNLINKMQEEAAMKIIGQLYRPALRFANSQLYRTIKEQGEWAEAWVGQTIFRDYFRLDLVSNGKLSGGRRGFDGVFKDSEGNIIILESKVCFSDKPKTFQSALGEGYGFQQASSEWIKEVAQRMKDNEGRAILDAMNQGKLKVMGTFIDLKSSTIQILEKNDHENGKIKWKHKDLLKFDSGIPDFRDK
jgi:hypothetical protein